MKMNLGYNLRRLRRARALKLGTAIILFAIANSGLLPAAQLWLKHNVTQQIGGGVYQGVTDSWMEYQNKYNFGADYDLYVGEHSDGVGDAIIMRFELPAVTCQSILSATQWLWYVDSYQMNYNNTALQIAPFRLKPGYGWYENNGGSGGGHGGGLANHGVSYWYRDANDTLEWTSDYAGFYDSVDDGNGRQWIKRTGGTVTYALAPQQWVPFDVRPSVANWYAGTENNGLGLYTQGYLGSDSTADGDFASKENTDYGPTLNITYSGAQIAWTGASSSTWDGASYNWNVGGYLGTYGDGDFVSFADGAANPAIGVTGGGVSPGSVTINNASTIYSFSGGSINGGGTLTKQGTGQATLSAANGYSGLTLIKAGTLIVAANNALGTTGSGTVVSNGAALGFQGGVNYSSTEPITISGGGGGGGALYAVSGNNTFAGTVILAADSMVGVASGLGLALNGAISGGFNLAKTGQGTLTFGGGTANTYGGTTYVTQGTLALSGLATIPDSPVIDVAAAATLDVSAVTGGFMLGATAQQTLKGSGTVSGSVAAKALARLEPGDSAGTLTFLNNLSLAAGVTNYFELTNSLAIGGGTNDLVVVGANLTLSSNVIAITVLSSDPLSSGSYRLFNYAGAKTGSFNPTPIFLSGASGPGSTATIDESVTNQVNLVVVVPIATTMFVSSAPNPSLPSMNVTITATVNANVSGTNTPTGTVTFKTNSVPLGPPVSLVNGVATVATSALPHGFTPVWAEYPGDGLFLGSTGSVVQLVNAPPIPGYHVAYVLKNEPLVLSVAALLANDYDPDGDPLNITQVGALSTNGGTAALVNGTNVAYLPEPDYVGSDLLTYTLGDPYTTVTGAIYVHVLSGGDLTNSIIAITNQGGGAVTLTVAGIPGWTYQVQAVTKLTFPLSWQTLSTNTADTNGLFQFTDLGATNAERYYRSTTQTNLPDYSLYDAELLQLDILTGGARPGVMIRESPTLPSLGVTRIEPQPDGPFVISSFFDVFTELSLNNGITWLPATNGSIPLILVGGTLLNEFPGNTLPPPAGQYISPPDWPEVYPQGIVIKNLTLHSFTATFPPPPPGQTTTLTFGATVDLWMSSDGRHLFLQYTAPCQVTIRIKGRLNGS